MAELGAINKVHPMAEVEAINELDWVKAMAGVAPRWNQWTAGVKATQ